MTSSNQQQRLQQLADDLRGCDVVAYPVSGPGFCGLALAARDGSGRTATLSLDDALRARLSPSPRGLVLAVHAALGLPVGEGAAGTQSLTGGESVRPMELAALISSSASTLHAMTASRGAYDLVDTKLVDQVAGDVAALVARARALACPV